MSQVAIDEMIEGCRQSVYQRSLQIKSQVWETLSASGIDPDAIDGLVSIFDDSFDPFYGMESQYKHEKFFREEFGLLVSGHSGVHWCVCVHILCVCVHVCLPHTCMFAVHTRVCKYSYTCIHIFMYLLFLATRGVWCKKGYVSVCFNT